MKLETKLALILALILIPIGINQVENLNPQEPAPQVKGIQQTTKVTASIGKYYLTISGLASPQASVLLSCSVGNLQEETLANNDGFFIFEGILLPYSFGELSLIAQDTNGLPSPPVYLPELSPTSDIVIENILLPPSLTFSSGTNDQNNQSWATGKTFPNSKVLVYLYSQPKTTLWQRIKTLIVQSVYAKSAPRLEVESNSEGEFEFSLPSVDPAEQKLFVASLAEQISLMTEEAKAASEEEEIEETALTESENKEDNYSPKSFTLTFETYSIWEKIAAWIILSIAQLIIWIKNKPSNIIWLAIPLLLILTLEVLFRGWLEKMLYEEEKPLPPEPTNFSQS